MTSARRWSIDLTLLLTRLALGGYLALAGFAKAAGEINNGLGSFYNGYFQAMQPAWLPDILAAPYGYALPWLEIVVGLMVALGFATTLASLAQALMIASFTIALAMAHGLDAQPDSAPGPFSANYIMIAATLLIAAAGPGRVAIDRLIRGRRHAGPASAG